MIAWAGPFTDPCVFSLHIISRQLIWGNEYISNLEATFLNFYLNFVVQQRQTSSHTVLEVKDFEHPGNRKAQSLGMHGLLTEGLSFGSCIVV